MTDALHHGLMMDDYPLSLTSVVERAELLSAQRKVVSRRPDGQIHRTTVGECAARARRLGSALTELGVGDGDRVATLMWNQPEHLEAYFSIPSSGAVIHTLNPRLHPDELSFIVDDAEDAVLIVDESLLGAFEGFREAREFKHVIVVSQGEPAPDGTIDYETLISSHEPMQWPTLDERRAAAMCYTSGTTGRPEGRRLLAPLARAALADGGASRLQRRLGAGHDPPGRADVPRQRVGAAVHRHVRRRGARAPGPQARPGERARPDRRRARDADRGRADRVDGAARRARRRARPLGPERAPRDCSSAARRCRAACSRASTVTA